jgi:hypothetical protein
MPAAAPIIRLGRAARASQMPSAHERLTAVPCALVLASASYRVSPGSWPDFARGCRICIAGTMSWPRAGRAPYVRLCIWVGQSVVALAPQRSQWPGYAGPRVSLRALPCQMPADHEAVVAWCRISSVPARSTGCGHHLRPRSSSARRASSNGRCSQARWSASP